MVDVKQLINEICSKKEIHSISFSGCGGSLACFYAPYYYVTRVSDKLSATYTTANEFVHDTPISVDNHALVVVASRKGNTAETVEAARKAKQLGATTIGLAYLKDTALEEVVDYIIHYEVGDDALFEETKAAYALKIAYELVNTVEGDKNYEKMRQAMTLLNTLIPDAKKAIMPKAIRFAQEYQNDTMIYTMGSGCAWSSAQQQSICIFMEMQWISSAVIHTGEFFHGPFEITDENTAFLLLKSTGKTRKLDDRAINFLNNFNHHLTVIDAMDYGFEKLGDVSEYFDALFYTAMLGVFNPLLADLRNHPLSKRRYMWKYAY